MIAAPCRKSGPRALQPTVAQSVRDNRPTFRSVGLRAHATRSAEAGPAVSAVDVLMVRRGPAAFVVIAQVARLGVKVALRPRGARLVVLAHRARTDLVAPAQTVSAAHLSAATTMRLAERVPQSRHAVSSLARGTRSVVRRHRARVVSADRSRPAAMESAARSHRARVAVSVVRSLLAAIVLSHPVKVVSAGHLHRVKGVANGVPSHHVKVAESVVHLHPAATESVVRSLHARVVATVAPLHHVRVVSADHLRLAQMASAAHSHHVVMVSAVRLLLARVVVNVAPLYPARVVSGDRLHPATVAANVVPLRRVTVVNVAHLRPVKVVSAARLHRAKVVASADPLRLAVTGSGGRLHPARVAANAVRLPLVQRVSVARLCHGKVEVVLRSDPAVVRPVRVGQSSAALASVVTATVVEGSASPASRRRAAVPVPDQVAAGLPSGVLNKRVGAASAAPFACHLLLHNRIQ